jgi:phosphoribosylformylglycinamidine synthase
MAFGYDPWLSDENPFLGASCAVIESVSKLIAAGFSLLDAYLTLQEYFPRTGSDPKRWGMPLAAVLGAFEAQMGLGVAAVGGKDSMSGTYMDIDVPPTLVSFAVASGCAKKVLTGDFSQPGSRVYALRPPIIPTARPTIRASLRCGALLRAGRGRARALRPGDTP